MDFLFELGELVGVGCQLPKEVGAFGLEVVEATLDGSHLPFVFTLGDSLLQLEDGLLPGLTRAGFQGLLDSGRGGANNGWPEVSGWVWFFGF